jgi:hypothetical protein
MCILARLGFESSLFLMMRSSSQGYMNANHLRNQAWTFHFNVSLTALNIAKYDQLPTRSEDDTEPLSFSMATYKRLAFNQHLLERFISILDLYLTLIKSHPNNQNLLPYGFLRL